MGIKRPDNSKMTIRGAIQHLKDGTLNLNHRIQRNNVWTLEQGQLLISSILENVKIPGIVIVEENGVRYALDGKQRINNTTGFFENKFNLSDKIELFEDIDFDELESEEPISIQDIAGKYYEELPQAVKNKLQKFEFKLDVYKNLTDRQIKKLFRRYNGGTLLTKMELTRVSTSSEVIDYINELSEHDYFKNNIAISENQRNRFTDQEIIFQILSVLMKGYEKGLSSKEIKELAIELEDNGIQDNIKEIIKNATDYIYQAIPVKEKFMKKVNIPIIFNVAVKAQNNEITPEKFGGFLQMFFNDIPTEYDYATDSGSAKKENVKIRIDEMNKYFDENIDSAPEYQKPKERVKGNVGRPKGSTKNKEEKLVDSNPPADPVSMAAVGNPS